MRDEQPDPSRFPAPPKWASWVRGRIPQFKTHSSLAYARSSIRGISRYDRPRNASVTPETFIYEWVDGDWTERWHLDKGPIDATHEFWALKENKKKVRPVSEKAVAAAIASILGES